MINNFNLDSIQATFKEVTRKRINSIPRIIHQSYKTTEHPYSKMWQQSWIDYNSGWDYRFYTDSDNRQIVIQYFPQFLEAYDAFPFGIMRADFSRFLYLYLWGGVYADLDYVCLKPFDELLHHQMRIGIPELPQNPEELYHNALLISEAQNPFWLKCAEQAVTYYRSQENPAVICVAGPMRIQWAIETEKPSFVALSRSDVTPIDWYDLVHGGSPEQQTIKDLRNLLSNSSIESMRRAFPKSYAITFWNHDWWSSVWKPSDQTKAT